MHSLKQHLSFLDGAFQDAEIWCYLKFKFDILNNMDFTDSFSCSIE